MTTITARIARLHHDLAVQRAVLDDPHATAHARARASLLAATIQGRIRRLERARHVELVLHRVAA